MKSKKTYNISPYGGSPAGRQHTCPTGRRATPNSQRGVTLVIAMVMLAAVTFVSFALSTIIIREIVVARVILQSEPAISSAISGGEVGLYNLFRELGGTTVNSEPSQFSQGNTNYQVISNLYSSSYAFSITGGQELKVGLYDAEKPDNKNPSPAYASLVITNNAGSSSMTYRVNTWSQPDSAQSLSGCSGTVGANSSSPLCPLPTTGSDNRFVIFLQPGGGGSATGKVTAYQNSDGTTVRGIPAGNQQLTITGTSKGASRRIEINVTR